MVFRFLFMGSCWQVRFHLLIDFVHTKFGSICHENLFIEPILIAQKLVSIFKLSKLFFLWLALCLFDARDNMKNVHIYIFSFSLHRMDTTCDTVTISNTMVSCGPSGCHGPLRILTNNVFSRLIRCGLWFELYKIGPIHYHEQHQQIQN